MENSLVSICIPTFNGEKYIVAAINSCLVQTYQNIEIVISDDCSDDNTIALIKNISYNTNVPIHIYLHDPNGIGANWNNCIKKANGAYIKFLFQDDLLEPTCISKMIRVFENNTTIMLVCSKRHILIQDDYYSEKVKLWKEKYEDLQKKLNLRQHNGVSIIDKKIFKSKDFLMEPLNIFGEPSTILFKKILIEKVGDFREDLKQILDFEFCNRVLLQYKIGIINEKLMYFRLHSEQATNKNEGDNHDLLIYDRIVYDQYFLYLNFTNQIKLLKKNSRILNILYRLKKSIIIKHVKNTCTSIL